MSMLRIQNNATMSVICKAPAARKNRRFQTPGKISKNKIQESKEDFLMIRSIFGRVLCENLGEDLRLKHYRRKPCDMMLDINTREIVASCDHEKLANYFYKKYMQPRKVNRIDSDRMLQGKVDNFSTAAVEHPEVVHDFTYNGLRGLILKEGFIYCPRGLPNYGRGHYRSAQFRNVREAPPVGTLVVFSVEFNEFSKLFFVTECIVAHNRIIFHVLHNFEPHFKEFPLPVFRTWGKLLSPLQDGTVFVQTAEFGIVEDFLRIVRADGWVWVTPLFTPPFTKTLFCVVGLDGADDPLWLQIVRMPWEVALNQLAFMAQYYLELIRNNLPQDLLALNPPQDLLALNPPQDQVVPAFAPLDPVHSPNPRRRRAYSESMPAKVMRMEAPPAIVDNNQHAAPQDDFELPDQFPVHQRNEGELSPINQRIQQILQARQNAAEAQGSDEEDVPADPAAPEDNVDMP